MNLVKIMKNLTILSFLFFQVINAYEFNVRISDQLSNKNCTTTLAYLEVIISLIFISGANFYYIDNLGTFVIFCLFVIITISNLKLCFMNL